MKATLIILFSTVGISLSEDYTCPSGQSSKTITINDGDIFTYKTQEGETYDANVDCTVNYRLGSSCKKMKMSCERMILKGAGRNCRRGDKIILSNGGKKKKYVCGDKSNISGESSKNARVQLLTDQVSGARGSGAGGECRVSCSQGNNGTPPSGDNVLEKISLDQHPLAQCNDLTTAVYYRHPLINQATSKKMLIFLKGGGFCVPGNGRNSCNKRCGGAKASLCTASTESTWDLNQTSRGGTIFSSDAADNPAFYDYSKVYVPYCSSDLYSGTANASAATEGRVFHGKYIFKAIINDLLANTWLNEATDLVLIGTSAGSAGVDRNCDWMSDQVKSVNPGLNVKCIMDSGSFFPMKSYIKYCLLGTEPSQREDPTNLWQPEFDETCVSQSSDINNCKTLTWSYKYVSTTSMILTSATDSHTLKNCEGFPRRNQEAALQEWRSEMVETARSVSSERPDFGFYIENCRYHTTVGNKQIYFNHDVPVEDGGVGERKSLKDILNNFSKQKTPKVGIDNIDQLNPKCKN